MEPNIKSVKYWVIENTGWSNSTSWFPLSAGIRYATKAEAIEQVRKYIVCDNNPYIKWRITKVKAKYKYCEIE